jgi:hypothetical protein
MTLASALPMVKTTLQNLQTSLNFRVNLDENKVCDGQRQEWYPFPSQVRTQFYSAQRDVRSEESVPSADRPFSAALTASVLGDTGRMGLRLGGCASGQSRLVHRGA